MKSALADMTEEYASVLQEYLEGSEEPALVHAYELGRRAINQDMGLLELTGVHRIALETVLGHAAGNERRHVNRAAAFLREALGPFEMALRGYKDANAALKRAMEEADDARGEAQRANQAKSEFLSRMSHELRTPLNAILGFGQLLEGPHSEEEKREYVQHILTSGRHLLDLINEIMDISRIEAGTLALSMEPLLLEEAVQETVDMVRPMAKARTIALEWDGRIVDRHVLADRQRLKQILLNLLSNAVKYNVEGGRVTLTSKEAGERRIRLEVADTGHGIAPELRTRLFAPFERLGAEETATQGTGLGLALTKGLVEVMGGSIGVESEEGLGTTFWIELSTADPPPTGPTLPHPRDGAALSDVALANVACTVLYIEDSGTNLRLVQQILARYSDVHLLSAMNGRLGLNLAREHHPDVILLDLHLPDLSGQEVLRTLREDPATREIPVAIVTADATSTQARRLLASGARAYLTKPFDVRELLALVESIKI